MDGPPAPAGCSQELDDLEDIGAVRCTTMLVLQHVDHHCLSRRKGDHVHRDHISNFIVRVQLEEELIVQHFMSRSVLGLLSILDTSARTF